MILARESMVNIMEYIFNVSTIDCYALLLQVSQALEKRTELISRNNQPKLWKYTDKLNGQRKVSAVVSKRRKVRIKAYGIINLTLGIFLIIPGLMDPKELMVPLVAGVIATLLGTTILLSSRKNKKNPFLKSAKLLLDNANIIPKVEIQVLFTDKEMKFNTVVNDTKTVLEEVLYTDFECMIETKDIFLLTYNNCATILQKKDLSTNNVDDFSDYINSKLELIKTL